jgi:hypothetical protein
MFKSNNRRITDFIDATDAPLPSRPQLTICYFDDAVSPHLLLW